jgi:hypothetical protein
MLLTKYSFISSHGLVGVRQKDNIQDFTNPLVVAYYDVDYVKNPKGTNYWRNRVLKVFINNNHLYLFNVNR